MPEQPSGSVLAFDYGMARIGVAQGDTRIGIAHPLETIRARDKHSALAQIATLIDTWRPDILVVGLPLQSDGKESEMCARARRFARRLAERFRQPVYLADERWSSAAAEGALHHAGVHGRQQKPVLDQVAAMNILETFFSGAVAETVLPRTKT